MSPFIHTAPDISRVRPRLSPAEAERHIAIDLVEIVRTGNLTPAERADVAALAGRHTDRANRGSSR